MAFIVLRADERDRLAAAELTYPEVGATTGDLPAGYHQLSRIGPLRRQAPCRIVYVVDEPRRGFACGTLPGQPGTPLAKVTGPLGAIAQRQKTSRYLSALKRR